MFTSLLLSLIISLFQLVSFVSLSQSKLAFERLNIKKEFHPFICGPNNTFIKQLSETTGARINVPPPSVMKDEIVVSGEKDGVHQAKTTIMKIYEEKVCRTDFKSGWPLTWKTGKIREKYF